MLRHKQATLFKYSIAIIASLMALFIKAIFFEPIESNILMLSLTAVMISSWYGGLGPGLIAIAISIVGNSYLFFEPKFSFIVANFEDILKILVFFLAALIISSLNTKLLLAQQVAEQSLLQVQKAYIEEEKARTMAEEANKYKDEFLALISHELRTPVTVIIGWVELIKDGLLSETETQDALKSIEIAANNQVRIIEELLDACRIITGKVHLDKIIIEINYIITAVTKTIESMAKEKNISVESNIYPKPIKILGSFEHLEQVFFNLLSNAVKFTPVGGKINILLTIKGSYAQVVVKDTGKGITKDSLSYIFDPFRQADSSINRNYGGLGLGLATVKRLVELHEGTIEADSLGETKGATFTIYLPISTN